MTRLSHGLIPLAIAVFMLCACTARKTPAPPLSPLAYKTVSDRSCASHRLLASFPSSASEGEIYILGSIEQVRAMSEYLLHYDGFDNVDASSKPDLLPDFSGETFGSAALLDTSFLQDTTGGGMNLRNLNLGALLSCIDTVGGKARGKAVVLLPDEMSAYLRYDMDSLARAFSLPQLVFSPISLSIDKAIADGNKRIAIVSNKPIGLLRKCVRQPQDSSAIVSVIPVSAFRDSAGVNIGTVYPDVIIADDLTFNADSVKAYLPLAKLIDPRSQTAKAVFLAMRERNCFTHKVAYPAQDIWIATAGTSDDFYFSFTGTDE